VLARSSKTAYSLTRSMLWKLGHISIIYMLLIRLYTLEPAMFLLPLPLSSMREPLNICCCGGLSKVV
jgi:hypothetical protein